MSPVALHRLDAAVAAATALILLTASSAPALTNAAQEDLCPLVGDLPPNFARKCIDAGGDASGERCWLTYTPPAARLANNATTDHPGVPLVVDLHGFTSCAIYNTAYTGWKERAEADGFVVVYPQGTANSDVVDLSCFNAGQCCCFKGFRRVDDIDDVSFLRMLIADTMVGSDVPVDPDRVYLSGHSNGCMMAQRTAAELSDLVAAVCCHSGINVAYGAAKDFPVGYGGSTSLLTIHGDADDTVPYGRSEVFGLTYPGAEENIALWAEANKCNSGPVVVEDGGGSFATHTYAGCGADGTAEVKLIQLYGVGHNPYKEVEGTTFPPEFFETDVDTTKLAQDFCFEHRLSLPGTDGPTDAPTLSPTNTTSQTPTDAPAPTTSGSDAMSLFYSTMGTVLMVLGSTLLLF